MKRHGEIDPTLKGHDTLYRVQKSITTPTTTTISSPWTTPFDHGLVIPQYDYRPHVTCDMYVYFLVVPNLILFYDYNHVKNMH